MAGSLLTGNPVYNGGSPIATSGTVDPTGYVQRSLTTTPDTTGADGQSDSRSGLASAIVTRLNSTLAPTDGTTGTTGTTTTPTPSGTVTPQRTDSGQYFAAPNVTHAAGMAPTTTPYSGGPVGVIVTWPDGSTQNEFYTPSSQEEYNQLAANGWHYNVTADMANLPQSPDVTTGLNALQDQDVTQRQSLADELQSQLSGLTQSRALAQSQLPTQQQQVRSNFGGRGMLFSTGYANADQNVLDALQRRLAGYDQQEQADRTGNADSLQKFLNGENQRKQELLNQQAAYVEQQLQDSNIKNAIEQRLRLAEGQGINPGGHPAPPPARVVAKPIAKAPAKPVAKGPAKPTKPAPKAPAKPAPKKNTSVEGRLNPFKRGK